MTKYIYTITAMKFGLKYSNTNRSKDGYFHSFERRTSPTQKKHFTIIRKRTWGWFDSLKNAQKAVSADGNFILENMYFPEVVIEKIANGFLFDIPKEWWYKWQGTEKKGKYKPWKKPKQYKNVIGFSMG